MFFKKNQISKISNTYKYLLKKFNKKKNLQKILLKKKIDKNVSIKMSYDIQAGSYINFFKSISKKKFEKVYSPIIETYFKEFKNCKTILDFGCGELTSSLFLFSKIKKYINKYFACDISLNRLYIGKNYIESHLKHNDRKKLKIFCNSDINLPFRNNSIDLILTIHSLEPNNNTSKQIITELFRVANKGLILMEPHYEIANSRQKKRMKNYNYIKGLERLLKNKNYKLKIIKKDSHINELNKSSLFILKKIKKIKKNKSVYVEPKTLVNLKSYNNFLYSDKTLRVFPNINDITIFSHDTQLFLPKIKK